MYIGDCDLLHLEYLESESTEISQVRFLVEVCAPPGSEIIVGRAPLVWFKCGEITALNLESFNIWVTWKHRAAGAPLYLWTQYFAALIVSLSC